MWCCREHDLVPGALRRAPSPSVSELGKSPTPMISDDEDWESEDDTDTYRTPCEFMVDNGEYGPLHP